MLIVTAQQQPESRGGTGSFVSLLFAKEVQRKPLRSSSLDGVPSKSRNTKAQWRSISLGRSLAVRKRTGEESKEQLPPTKNKAESSPAAEKDDDTKEGEILGRAYLEMANARAALGDWEGAIYFWDKAILLQTKGGATDHSAVAETLIRRGTHLASIGLYFEAVFDLDKASRIKTAIFKSNPSERLSLDLANVLVQLSNAQCQLKLYDESLRSLNAALSRRKHILGEYDVQVAEIHYRIAQNYHRRRKYSEARISYLKALDLFRKVGIRRDDPTFLRVRRCAADRNIAGQLFWENAASGSASI
mmetsp:Transcript_17832/g.29507  ORF Transcript_17832/g.29507 Transcript_17832/m.29507 type:complete len:303 (-) Transcript_17832:265-1173(-)